MHPSHSQLLAEQIQADRLRNAEAARRLQMHREALGRRPAIRTFLGDTLVATGNRVSSLGDRIVATASPPTTTTSRSPIDMSREGAATLC